MKTYLVRAAVGSAVATLALSTAWAYTSSTNFGGNAAPAGAHFRQGASVPVCGVSGLTVSCTGTEIAGVGGTDADLLLSVSYSATVQCKNNGGKIVDVKTQITAAGDSDDLTDVRNGTLYVSPISVTGPTTQSFLNAATCPNGNWTKLLQGYPTVTSFTYTLMFQGYTEAVVSITGP